MSLSAGSQRINGSWNPFTILHLNNTGQKTLDGHSCRRLKVWRITAATHVELIRFKKKHNDKTRAWSIKHRN